MQELFKKIEKLSDKNKRELSRYLDVILAFREKQITGQIFSNVSQGTVLKIGVTHDWI